MERVFRIGIWCQSLSSGCGMILESGGSHVLHPIVKVAARVDLHAALIQHFTFRHCCLSFSLVDCGFSRSVNGCGSASVTMD